MRILCSQYQARPNRSVVLIKLIQQTRGTMCCQQLPETIPTARLRISPGTMTASLVYHAHDCERKSTRCAKRCAFVDARCRNTYPHRTHWPHVSHDAIVLAPCWCSCRVGQRPSHTLTEMPCWSADFRTVFNELHSPVATPTISTTASYRQSQIILVLLFSCDNT